MTTDEFETWINNIDDLLAVATIRKHLQRIKDGNLGKTRQVCGDIYEKKINYAGGYRLYYFIKIRQVIVMLVGGTKRTQQRDIKMAQQIRKDIYDRDIT